MRKSLLNLYLQKVAEGDRSYVDRLCKQLSDRLIFAPVVSSPASASGARAKSTFSVLRITEGARSLVPIFTSEKRFKEWGEKRSHGGGSISLLGGDFCAALGADTWVTIDPGFEENLEIEPALVVKISESGLSEEPAAPQEDSIEIEIPQSQSKPPPSAAKGIVNNAMFSSQAKSDEFIMARDQMNAAKPQSASTSEEIPSVGSKFIRSAIFSSAQGAVGDFQAEKALEKAGLAAAPKSADAARSSLAGTTLSSAATTPQEKPADEAPEPKKKKSFLSFLKGN
ncbi:MAG: SseB family protein [Deltaproteobacteria bacterium]|nr:SseB family protein [Deltaproteobacteria bacterium]